MLIRRVDRHCCFARCTQRCAGAALLKNSNSHSNSQSQTLTVSCKYACSSPHPTSLTFYERAIISASSTKRVAALATAAEMLWQNVQINYAKWHVEFIFQRNSLNSLAVCQPACLPALCLFL